MTVPTKAEGFEEVIVISDEINKDTNTEQTPQQAIGAITEQTLEDEKVQARRALKTPPKLFPRPYRGQKIETAVRPSMAPFNNGKLPRVTCLTLQKTSHRPITDQLAVLTPLPLPYNKAPLLSDTLRLIVIRLIQIQTLLPHTTNQLHFDQTFKNNTNLLTLIRLRHQHQRELPVLPQH